jgi:F-type H+-transporting ATPase subunit gamma
MSETTTSLHRKLDSAKELQSVVRTMKALTASSIGQYQKSILALVDYSRSVELGLGACLRQNAKDTNLSKKKSPAPPAATTAIIFGSDQGLVGQFNDVVADFAVKNIRTFSGQSQIWAVGERIHSRLLDSGLQVKGLFAVPNSVEAITPLVGKILVECEKSGKDMGLNLFYNHSAGGALYAPHEECLLPLDQAWSRKLANIPWPTKMMPELIGTPLLHALIREYLFISLFRSCAESLAAENAYRLAAMQRADKNIDGLLETLTSTFNHLRQSRIDEELFDVVSGFETLSREKSNSF